MGLYVLLQILRALEALAAEFTLVRLERNVNPDVRGNVVTLDSSCATRVPLAGEVQVVGALAANMFLTEMVIKKLSALEALAAVGAPAAHEVVLSLSAARGRARGRRSSGRRGRCSIGRRAGRTRRRCSLRCKSGRTGILLCGRHGDRTNRFRRQRVLMVDHVGIT